MLCLNLSDIAIITVKGIDIVVLLMTLANLKQFICWKILCLIIMDIYIYKMNIKDINIKNRVYSYCFDNLIKVNKK